MIEYWQISYTLAAILLACISAFVIAVNRLGSKDD